MTEYIKKERALEAVTRNLPLYGDEWVAAYNIVGAIPPEDVAPAIHARWEGIWGDGYAEDEEGNPQIVYEEFECSNCGQEHLADGEPEWDYCPKCGARMGGEEND